jgi:hypothetical protein
MFDFVCDVVKKIYATPELNFITSYASKICTSYSRVWFSFQMNNFLNLIQVLFQVGHVHT